MKLGHKQTLVQGHQVRLTCLFSLSVPSWPCRHNTSFLWALCDTERTVSNRFSICMWTMETKHDVKKKISEQSGPEFCQRRDSCISAHADFPVETNQVRGRNHNTDVAHPCLNFASCSCYWKLMEDVSSACLARFYSVQCFNRRHRCQMEEVLVDNTTWWIVVSLKTGQASSSPGWWSTDVLMY